MGVVAAGCFVAQHVAEGMVDEEHCALGGEMVGVTTLEAVIVLEACGVGKTGQKGFEEEVG